VKRRAFQALSPIAVLLVSLPAWAQLDTSSALLRPSGKKPTAQSLDSSRYKIRAPESRKDDEIEEAPGTFIPSPVPKNPKESAKVQISNTVRVEPVVQPTPAPATPPPVVTEEKAEAHPPVTVQVKELFLGGTDEDIDDAKKQIHPEDPRANILNISIAPAYFYDGSSSNYAFRNYHTDGPGFGLGMSVWFTPFFGVQSKYFSSVSSSVRAGASVVPVDNQEFEAGIRFRRYFGYTRKSAQISWGIDYHDASNKISPDATESIGRKTSGLSVGIEGSVPSSNTYAHSFEVAIRPFQHHSEMNTAANAKSGTKNETNAVALSVGGQWTLDRRNQVFWKAQYSVERNLFQGDASAVDPKTDVTPNGVSVTNSMAVFYFGFKWGS
jgi:hypothetical protein